MRPVSDTDELPTTGTAEKSAKDRPGSPYGHVFPGPPSKGAAGTSGGVPRRVPGLPGAGHLPTSRQRFEELPHRVEPRKMSFLERLYLPLLSGLLVTARHFFRNLIHGPKYTIEYPEERRAYSHRFRGHHILTTRPDGSPRCVACYLCAQACPAECIRIEAGEHPDVNIEKYPVVYEIDMLRCVFCGYCVDACPEEAIIMSNNYDMAYFSRDQTIAGKADLMKPFTFDPERLGYRPTFPEEQAREKERMQGSGGPDDAERARMRRKAFDLVTAAREARDSDGNGAEKGAA